MPKGQQEKERASANRLTGPLKIPPWPVWPQKHLDIVFAPYQFSAMNTGGLRSLRAELFPFGHTPVNHLSFK